MEMAPSSFAIPIYAGIHPPSEVVYEEITFNLETLEQVINHGHTMNEMAKHLSSNQIQHVVISS